MKSGNNEPNRVLIDTNIWISFLIGKRLSGLHRHIDSGRIKIVACEAQLRELVDVLNRPRIRKYIPAEQAEEFLDLFCEAVLFVKPEQCPLLCRDSKDDYLRYTVLVAQAEYLVSDNGNLLPIRNKHWKSMFCRTNVLFCTQKCKARCLFCWETKRRQNTVIDNNNILF